MTVPNPVSMPNPFEDAGSRVPQPGAHALGSDKPSIHSIAVRTRGMHPLQIETQSREKIVNDTTMDIGQPKVPTAIAIGEAFVIDA